MDDTRRVSLITGATGGLGGAVTHALLTCGAVVGTYRNKDEAERLRAGVGSVGDRLLLESVDVTNGDAVADVVRRTVARFGRLDHLINLVGGWGAGQPIWEMSDEHLDRMLNLNTRSAFVCCRAALPQMLAQNFGRVVTVASRTALYPEPRTFGYALAKRGVITLTETLALELRDYDVTVNCVVPSVIDTPANRRDIPGADFSRWVRPEQLAAVIRWLTSPDAAPINGAVIPVYGRA